MDTVGFYPSQCFIDPRKVNEDDSPHGFRSLHSKEGRDERDDSAIYVFPSKTRNKGQEIVKVFTTPIGSSRSWVSKIDANLPKLLWGHNGRTIKTLENQLLAITRLRHVVSKLVDAETRHWILPGIGEGNLGYWNKLHLPVHVEDDGLLIAASHGLRRPRGQKQVGIYPGQSTTYEGSGFGFCIYDKGRKQLKGTPTCDPGICCRIEAKMKTPAEVAKAFSRGEAGHGEVLSTFSFNDALDAFHYSMDPILSRIGVPTSNPTAPKTPAFLQAVATMFGSDVAVLMELYFKAGKPSDPETQRRIKNQVAALSAEGFRKHGFLDDLASHLLTAPEIIDAEAEARHRDMAEAWDWPMEAAADIVAAYSAKSFISKPSKEDRMAQRQRKLLWDNRIT